jgi:CubicO group peptidase (beta-lactamase class C family)
MTLNRLLLWLLVLPLLGDAVTAQESALTVAIAEFASEIQRDVEADGIGSIAAAVTIGGSVIWADAFGVMDRDGSIPATDSALYRTGSISKSVTAVTMMVLAERGLLALNDPVERFLPEIRQVPGYRDSTPITLRHLASHTSGLVREPQLKDAAKGPIEGWEYKILESIPHSEQQWEPGSRYSYSNIGFGILGLTISRAVGVPFTVLVDSLIFQPAGMKTATFVVTPDAVRLLSLGYENDEDGEIDAREPALEHRGRGYKVPNGGVYASVYDLARFVDLLSGVLGDTILAEATRAEILRIQTPESDTTGYGIGFEIRIYEDGGRVVGHWGSVAGYTANMQFDPDKQIGVILLRNYQRGETDLGAKARHMVRRISSIEY